MDVFSNEIKNEISSIGITKEHLNKIELALKKLKEVRDQKSEVVTGEILLDFDEETTRTILATYDYIKNSFKSQFSQIVKKERDLRQHLGRINRKIKKGEVRKNNPIALKLREDKLDLTQKIETLSLSKGRLIEELDGLKKLRATNKKVLSEEEKKFKVVRK